MNLYSRARKHIDMNRVKEIREQKIRKQKISNLIERQLEIAAELKEIEREESRTIDWRRDINEQMTTAGMGMVNYPETGDTDVVDTEAVFSTLTGQNETLSGGEVLLRGSSNDIAGGTQTAFRQAFLRVDGSKSTTLKITISKGGGVTSWTDRGESWDDNVTLVVSNEDDPLGSPTYSTDNLSSGTSLIPLPGNYKNTFIQVQQFAKVASGEDPGTTGTLRISNASFQRRTPLNVFVPLDDPEALSFMRGGLGGSEERKAKLKDMLDAGNELMVKMGLDPSQTSPGDIELAGWGLRPDGTSGNNKVGDVVPDHFGNPMKLVPRKGYGYNQWVPVKKV